MVPTGCGGRSLGRGPWASRVWAMSGGCQLFSLGLGGAEGAAATVAPEHFDVTVSPFVGVLSSLLIFL